MLPRYKDIVELLKKGSTLEAQEQIMSLREGALELQEENHELKSKVRELESKLKEVDDWSNKKEKYALVNPWGGAAQVYAMLKEHSGGEAPHYLCSNCFHNKNKVILNPGKKDRWVIMVCPTCKATLETGYKGIGNPVYVEDIGDEG